MDKDFDLENIELLEDVAEGTEIILHCRNGNETKKYTGIFVGVEGDRILLKSPFYLNNPFSIIRFKKSHAIGFEL